MQKVTLACDHTMTHAHSVLLPWTSDRPVAEVCTCITQIKHKRQTAESSVGFEHAIPAIEMPQTYALDRAATGISPNNFYATKFLTPRQERNDCSRKVTIKSSSKSDEVTENSIFN